MLNACRIESLINCHRYLKVMHYSTGDALLTVATGELSEAQADRAGLVATHAYAILNVVQYKVSVSSL